MAGKQITYARRKGKKRPLTPSESSPLEDITDPEVEITRGEMKRRMTKRSRHSGTEFGASKTLKNKNVESHTQASNDNREAQLPEQNFTDLTTATLNASSAPTTPFRQSSDPDNAFGGLLRSGLPSSTGRSNGLDAKRPVLGVSRSRKVTRTASSSRLKENNNKAPVQKTSSKLPSKNVDHSTKSARLSTHPAPRGYTILASPFTSQPHSPQDSPRPISDSGTCVTTRLLGPRRALSDTGFDPNIPLTNQRRNYIQSAANSPTHVTPETKEAKHRRPSAPSATAARPDPLILKDNPIADPQDDLVKSFSFFDLTGNFPRGPQVDFNRPPSQLSFTSSYDERFFDEVQGISTPLKDQKSLHRADDDGFPMDYENEYPTPWITDSLISPPTINRAYSWPFVGDVPTEAHENKDRLAADALQVAQESTGPIIAAEAPAQPRDVIEDLLASLDLRNESNTLTSPSHPVEFQLDAPLLESPVRLSSVEPVIDKKPRGRDRRGTLKASDFRKPEEESTHPLAFTRTRSGTIVQALGAHRKRNRSDTVTACPPPSASVSSDQGGCLLPAFDPAEDTACNSFDGDEDELHLKEAWFDEAWVVASPPSPIIPRRKKRKGIKDWRAGHVLGKGIGTWGMKEHNEDDGTDDPLLLK